MDFISNKKQQIAEMLKTLGIQHIDALFKAIPENLKIPPPATDDGLSEFEALQTMEDLARENTFLQMESYLGAGAYQHHVPALVGAITSRSEFLTAYTPYQPEASQGLLQAIFEFQTAIAAVTALPVANAAVYDSAAACAEAVLMSLRLQKGKKRVLIADSVHPSYRGVVLQYLSGLGTEVHFVPPDVQGKISLSALNKLLNKETACVLIQTPNFFGVVEDLKSLGPEIHKNEALFIVCGNPLSYALFTPPGEAGCDIAVGDCQPFGLPLMFGGPYAGYMACKEQHTRQLPGRIVGLTHELNSTAKGFVLTLQAREQHIRREKATSNICTNQALATIAALVALLWYGPKGVRALALTNYQRTHYLRQNLAQLKGFSAWEGHFNEFTLKLPCSPEKALKIFRNEGIEPGLPLSQFYPQMNEHLLIAVTEMKSRAQLDRFIEVAKKL